MPNIKAAVKAVRQSERKHLRNVRVSSELRTLTKKFEECLSQRQPDQAKVQLHELLRRIDQAKVKGVLHAKAAARKKSRLSARLATLSAGAPASPAAGQVPPRRV